MVGAPVQICEDRLTGPAAHHYKTVCSLLFSESIELHHYTNSHTSSSKVNKNTSLLVIAYC